MYDSSSYKILNNSTETIKEIVDEKHEVSEKIKKYKKTIIIFGQSVFKLESSLIYFYKYIL